MFCKVYRPLPPSPYSQPFSTFITNSHRLFPMQPPPLMNSSLPTTSTSMSTTSAILKQFFDLLANCNLTQNVKIPTHRHGHTLDRIITPANTTLNPVITSSHIVTSAHYSIFTSINVHPNPPLPPTTFTYRRMNAIDYPKFIDDLNSSSLIINPPSCLPDLLDLFFATLRSLLDHHAPLLT